MAEPKDDLISKLVVEQLRRGHIEKSDAVQISFLLLVAGNATMVNMIALVRFLSSPARVPSLAEVLPRASSLSSKTPRSWRSSKPILLWRPLLSKSFAASTRVPRLP